MAGVVALVIAAALIKNILGRRGSSETEDSDSGFADRTTAWWLLAPVAASALVSWMVTPVILHKNLLICLPPCVVLLARCVWILRPPRWLPVALGVILVTGSLTQLIVVDRYYTTPTTGQFREAVRHVVLRSASAGSPPVAACVWNGRYLDYYFRQFGSDIRVEWVGCEVPRLAPVLAPGEPGSPERVWFVSAHRLPEPEVLDWFRGHYVLLESEIFIKAYVLLLEQRPGNGAAPPAPQLAEQGVEH
jgi:hypothetical protein